MIQALKATSTSQFDPTQLALALPLFLGASSPDDLRRVVARLPFMTDPVYIASLEYALAQAVSPEEQPTFKQRLAWLRQIANEQK